MVVTGLGTIGPHGWGRERLETALREGRPLLRPVDRSAGNHLPDSSALGALVPDLDLSPWVSPMEARRMGRPSKMAIAAARMALEDAQVPAGALATSRAAIVLSTAFGGVAFTERLLEAILFQGPEAASPFHFTECVSNAAAAEVAIAVGATGANVTLTQREAGSLLALARGCAEIRDGRADRVLAGSVEELTPMLHAILDRMRALARAEDGRAEAARPFDRRRNGFVAGEGATVLVLEAEDEARARGAHILARVVACGAGFDPTASAAGWGHGRDGLARGLSSTLERAAVRPGEVDGIVSGASGAIQGDRLEAHVLRDVWGEALPPVFVPKAVGGEYAGFILASSLVALDGAHVGLCAAFEEPDPDLGVKPHDGRPLPRPSRVLTSGLAAGGAAAWAVFERA